DGNGPVAELLVAEDAADEFAVFALPAELAEQLRDALDMLLGQFLTFAPQALAHLLPPAAGVDELHLASACLRFLVADDPDIGGNAGIVEHVRRQADDCLQ